MTRSYASGASAVPLVGRTIGDDLARTVARHGGREALVVPFQDVRLTYAELDPEVDAVARGLLGLGLERGDRLGIWSPSCAEWVLVQYATARVGVILVTINPAYRTHEVGYALRQSGCRVLVAAESFKTSDHRAMVAEVRGDLPALEHVVFLGTRDWSNLRAAGDRMADDAAAIRAATLDADDPINIQDTSGTTGAPKGATRSHHNILNNGFFVGEGCRYDERCTSLKMRDMSIELLGLEGAAAATTA